MKINLLKTAVILLFLITASLSLIGSKKSCKNEICSKWSTRFGLYWNPVAYKNACIDYDVDYDESCINYCRYGYFDPIFIDTIYPNNYSMFNDYGYWGYPGVYAAYGYPGFGIYSPF